MLENVEVLLGLYDQAGREGGKKEDREDIAEKGKRSRPVLGEGGGAKVEEELTWKIPSLVINDKSGGEEAEVSVWQIFLHFICQAWHNAGSIFSPTLSPDGQRKDYGLILWKSCCGNQFNGLETREVPP